MQRKNKAMIAAAIGMVAIVVATTAVRCSIAHTAGQADADPPAASLEQPAEQEGPETEPEAGEETDGASAVLEELRLIEAGGGVGDELLSTIDLISVTLGGMKED